MDIRVADYQDDGGQTTEDDGRNDLLRRCDSTASRLTVALLVLDKKQVGLSSRG